MSMSSRRPDTAHLAGVAVIGLCFVGMTLWTWRAWTDILVDFGREAYLPWRILAGEVLYRDLAYLAGPFSPYWNAWWYFLCGVSLQTLATVNLRMPSGV